jgi:two-component system, LuxR family, sensor kinase FixL
MSDPDRLQVLIIEDDADARGNLRDILELDGYDVLTAESLSQAFERFDWSRLMAVVLDRRLPEGLVDEHLPQLKERAPRAAVIIVTGYADLSVAIAALRFGAADFILKPIDAGMIRARLSRIAENRRMRDALDRSEAALEAVMQSVPCMIVAVGSDQNLQFFSPYAERLTGYTAADVLGRNFFDLFLHGLPGRPNAEREFRCVLSGGTSEGFESRVCCRDGSLQWMMWSLQRLHDYNGQQAVLAVLQNISALKQARERALQSERLAAIGQMMTGLAHESRNALQRSQSCLEMLSLEIADRPAAMDLVQRIQKAQDHLHQLYEEVRDYAAPLKLQQHDHDLRDILWETWEHLAINRAGRDAAIVEAGGQDDTRACVDRRACEQVFRNVIENSLAAGPDPVRIQIRWFPAKIEGRAAVGVSLTDNGPGFSSDSRRKIFEPFFTTKTKGTGLGMAISQRIIDANGGTISVGNTHPGAEIRILFPRDANGAITT